MDKKLDNFESFLKNSLNGHEAPYDASAWESMEQALSQNSIAADGFESFVKKSLDNHEAPYSTSAWKAVSDLLGKTAIPFYKTKLFIGLASALVISGIIFSVIPDNEIKKEELAVNKTVKQKSKTEVSTTINSVTNTNNNAVVTNKETTIKNDNSSVIQPDRPILINKKIKDEDISSVSVDPNSTIDNDANSFENEPKDIDHLPITASTDQTAPQAAYLVSFTITPSVCEGQVLNLAPNTIDNELTYKWLVNKKVISNEISTTVTLKNTGINNIDLIAYKDGEIVGSRTKDIIVNETPINNLSIKNDEYALVNNYTFSSNNNAKNIAWNFGDGETSKELKTNHTFKKQGKYTLSYSATNENGCSANFKKDIIVKGYYNIRDDHGFSPDGDGSLDVFMPEELKLINQPFEMVIYSRANGVVYKTNSINNPWNGRDLEGNMVPFGVYVWVINLTNEMGQEEVYKGSVTKASN